MSSFFRKSLLAYLWFVVHVSKDRQSVPSDSRAYEELLLRCAMQKWQSESSSRSSKRRPCERWSLFYKTFWKTVSALFKFIEGKIIFPCSAQRWDRMHVWVIDDLTWMLSIIWDRSLIHVVVIHELCCGLMIWERWFGQYLLRDGRRIWDWLFDE